MTPRPRDSAATQGCDAMQQQNEYIITEHEVMVAETNLFSFRERKAEWAATIRSRHHTPESLLMMSVVDAATQVGEASARSFDSGYALGLQHEKLAVISSQADIDTFGPFIQEHDAQIAAKEREKVLDKLKVRVDTVAPDYGIHLGWVLLSEVNACIESLRQREQPK